MPTAKRRINSTGRKRIMQENVDVRLTPVKGNEPLAATATLALADLGFPPEAAVVLEAYQRSSGMRFECGTVGKPNIPNILHLNEIDKGNTVLFRLKVIERSDGSGKILGLANRIRPAGVDDLDGRRSIFPIKEIELGPEVWQVKFDDAGPVLCLNFRVAGFKHRILENPMLQGVILPASFRIVLEKLAQDPVDDDDDEEDWRNLWFRYLRETFAVDDDVALMPAEDRQDWVDNIVRIFCQAHDFVDSIRKTIEGDMNGIRAS